MSNEIQNENQKGKNAAKMHHNEMLPSKKAAKKHKRKTADSPIRRLRAPIPPADWPAAPVVPALLPHVWLLKRRPFEDIARESKAGCRASSLERRLRGRQVSYLFLVVSFLFLSLSLFFSFLSFLLYAWCMDVTLNLSLILFSLFSSVVAFFFSGPLCCCLRVVELPGSFVRF